MGKIQSTCTCKWEYNDVHTCVTDHGGEHHAQLLWIMTRSRLVFCCFTIVKSTAKTYERSLTMRMRPCNILLLR